MFHSSELSGLLDIIDVGLLILDKQRRIVYCNPWFVERSRIMQEQLAGQSLLAVFPELEDSRVEDAVDRSLSEGYPSVISNVFNRTPFPLYPKGKIKGFEPKRIQQAVNVSRYEVAREGQCQIFCLIQIIDVSAAVMRELALELQVKERRIVEKTLEEERRLFVAGPSIVFKCRAEDLLPVEYISPNVYEQLGYKPEMFTSGHINFLDLLHADDLMGVTNEIANASLSGQSHFEQEFRLKNRLGEYRWFHEVMVVNRNKKGQISHFHGYMQDITQRKHAEADVKRLAYYDALTDLPNRRLFMDQLQQEMSRCQRTHAFGAVLFLDLNRFKAINDSLGHAIGDALLKGVGHRLRESLRTEDTVSRMGGDEFLVLLTQLGEEKDHAVVSVSQVVKKLIHILTQPFFLLEHEIQISPSIGICLFTGQDKQGPQDVIRHADIAMYHAKHHGNTYSCFYEDSMQAVADQRLMVEKNLVNGVRCHEFELYYQAQVDEYGEVFAAESLIRWNHPTRGMVSPAEFIPVAEEVGLIIPLGEWVIREACLAVVQWEREGMGVLDYLSVNVSPKQFHHADFLSKVQKILTETGVSAQRLVFEITEGLLIHDINDAVVKIKHLRKLGIRFAIDDFGTGYSSLAYLHRLPLDILKIDQSFIRELKPDDLNAPIVNNIISMAQHLSLDLVAEGVEHDEALNYLKERGCKKFQGYLFYRPLPKASFDQVLQGVSDQRQSTWLNATNGES
jgi:diguanylate cyclase (GGDEF)-like protein/PAS domain S-box-containing protein